MSNIRQREGAQSCVAAPCRWSIRYCMLQREKLPEGLVDTQWKGERGITPFVVGEECKGCICIYMRRALFPCLFFCVFSLARTAHTHMPLSCPARTTHTCPYLAPQEQHTHMPLSCPARTTLVHALIFLAGTTNTHTHTHVCFYFDPRPTLLRCTTSSTPRRR